jgi:hypothetical protein
MAHNWKAEVPKFWRRPRDIAIVARQLHRMAAIGPTADAGEDAESGSSITNPVGQKADAHMRVTPNQGRSPILATHTHNSIRYDQQGESTSVTASRPEMKD